MANYPKELLDLLQEYLTDGYIDNDERQVLLNKAQSLGVDPMEFNLYIKSQEQKIDFAKTEALNKEKGRLCPYCQQPLPMLADTCPHCNQAVTLEASKEAEELIDALESALVGLKAVAEKKKIAISDPSKRTDVDYATQKANVERYIRKAKMYYTNNKTINYLVSEIEQAVKDAENSIEEAKKAEKKKKLYMICGGVAAIIILIIMVICLGIYSDSKGGKGGKGDMMYMEPAPMYMEEAPRGW